MTINDEMIEILPILYLGVCLGMLLIGNLIFLSIYINSKNRLHLASLFLGLPGFFFIGFEILVIIAYYYNNVIWGRQFHRIQSLSIVYIFFSIPFLLMYLVTLNNTWKKINKILTIIGLICAIIVTIIAFIYPDLFVSITQEPDSSVNLSWDSVRGKTGILFKIRDIFMTLLTIYMMINMIFDMVWHKSYNYIVLSLIGAFCAIIFGYFDYLRLYGNQTGFSSFFYSNKYTSFFSIGITLFTLLSMIGVAQKIVDQSKYIEKAQKIESLGIFAGGIAHDFNNLLTAIIGNISLVIFSMKDKKNIELLKEAEKASMNAKDLTKQLLTFTRSGMAIKNISSMRKILLDTIPFILRGSNIKCGFKISEDLKNVNIDTAQISQVIHNIILNAKQSMPDGGLIKVAAENNSSKIWKLYPLKKGTSYIRISIEDTGIGISKKHKDKIFDPYFTTKETGNGLGLFVSYSIIKNHNGYIYVTSKENEGTLFEIFLPSVEKGDDTGVKEEQDNIEKFINADHKRILVLDDEQMILNISVKMLNNLGFEVITAREGKEAIKIYTDSIKEKNPIICVIMDLTIPGGMGGKNAVKKIREIDRDAKIIVSSGYSNDPIISEYKKYGFDGIIKKPYNLKEFSNAIFKVLGY